MDDLDTLVAATEAAFQGIYERSFRGDAATNPRLKVEVLEPAVVADTPTLVLITPWTLNGLFFPPVDVSARELVIDGERRPVFVNEIEELGRYLSVNLVPDVSNLQSPREARETARRLAEPFRNAVTALRDGETVADPSKRELFRRGSD